MSLSESANDNRVLDLPGSWWRDHLHVAVWLLVGGVVIFFLRFAAEAVVPIVLSGVLFYALDPAVDALHRWRIPRALGALLMMGLVLAGGITAALTLRDDFAKVVVELPNGARRLRQTLRADGGTSPLDSLKEATTEIDKTAAEAAGAATSAPQGVVRVQVEEPVFRASDYLWSGSLSLAALASQLAMVCFLAYFLLLADDLFKRKLVKHASSTLAGKRVTVQVLESIEDQIERFMLVQIFTSFVVAVATGAALWLLGLENAVLWGLVAGIFNSIPYFGPFIVTAGLGALAFLQFGTLTMTVAVAGTALLITSLEGWLLTPLLIGRAARMNQVAVFGGLLFWTWMWGVWGTLLAVPMMMVIKAVCDHVEDFQPVADFLSE
jgi:predicted PurR-regulated permease PerM